MSTDIRFIAKQYIDEGWSVVPVTKGEKRASTSWNSKSYTPADFREDDNLALKCGEPSGWRVDVDLDCPEAVAAAKELLPNTELIHGRPGKPSSHYWFFCKDIKTTQFTDVKADGKPGVGPMLVEIRSTGGYTVAPPSLHPKGEEIAWEVRRDAMTIEPGELYEAVRNVALVALLARRWNDYGHHAIGPLAGFLINAGVLDAVRLIKLAAQIAGATPDHVRDAVNFAQTTVGKFRAGEKVTGGPKLSEHLPENVVDKMRGWLKLADVDAIEEMNAKHFWVRMGKDDVIGREDTSTGVVFQRVKSLYSEYANKKIVVGETEKGKPEIKPLFQAWLEAKNRRSYREVVFCPPPLKADERDYNLWTGFGIEPDASGDCSMFLDFLNEVICSKNAEHYEYLLNLFALTCQEPGTPSEVAVVMRGKRGTGKGTLARAMGSIFAKHFVHLDKVDQVAGRFNAALSAKVIVFADEAFWAGDKKNLGALKRLITEPTLSIERKGVDIVLEHNHVHLFMAANDDWVVPAGFQERRFFVIEVSDARRGDYAYFTALNDSLRNGGLAGFLHMMLARPVNHELIRAVPQTSELRNQQIHGMSATMQWWFECLREAAIPGVIDEKQWTMLAPTQPTNPFLATWDVQVDLVYQAYVNWTQTLHRECATKIKFGMEMNDFIYVPNTVSVRNGKRERPLRTLSDARDYFDAEAGTIGEW